MFRLSPFLSQIPNPSPLIFVIIGKLIVLPLSLSRRRPRFGLTQTPLS